MALVLSVNGLAAILVLHCVISLRYRCCCSGINGIYEYPDEVDLRVIVLTYNRPHSLAQCLDHVNRLVTDGATVSVEVWLDRAETGDVDNETLQILANITWPGHIRHTTHIHPVHVGLYGQWLATWRPRLASPEIVLYLEDDVDLSPFAYRWLKTAYVKYRPEPELAGISLQEDYVITASGRRRGVTLKTPDYDPIYYYRIVGPWAFSPHPGRWRAFQDWFLAEYPERDPAVPGAGLYNDWYTDMKRQNRADTMWIIWYIQYCDVHSLYTAYANLRAYTKRPETGLAVNRREDGLHFSGRRRHDADRFLLRHWDDKFVNFPEKITKLDYDGSYS